MSDWAGAEGEHWADSAARYTKMLQPYGDALLAAAGLARGEHVLDVGCGNGDVSVAAARHVGDVGRVLGLDLSPAMLDVARVRARDAGLANVTFVQADASTWRNDDEVDVPLPAGDPGAPGPFAFADADRTRSILEPHHSPDGVVLGGAAWLVSARNDR